MIDHVSVPVRDLNRATAFYEAVLAVLGYANLDDRPATVGFGKKYSEFWINLRPTSPRDDDPGTHVALRAKGKDMVDAFHAAAIAHGGVSDGAPGCVAIRAKAITPPSSAILTATRSRR